MALPSQATADHLSCVIYARTATVKQAHENGSIEAQLESGRKHAMRQGWTIYKEYADLAASGLDVSRRPQFQAMLEDALKPNPPFSVILVLDDSRFFRNAAKAEATRRELSRNGVKVRYVIGSEDNCIASTLQDLMEAWVADQGFATSVAQSRPELPSCDAEGGERA